MTLAERENFYKAGFTKDQVHEIEEGIKAGVNTSVYASKDFMSVQMRQIRLGLMENLPVEIYANSQFDWFQMEDIRKGLKAGVDVKIYANPEISYEKMREIRKGLEVGMNLMGYLRFGAGVIRQLRKARVSGVNILKYINEGYDAEQLEEIRVALENDIDMSPFLSIEYRGASLAEIRKGLHAGIDVSQYAMIHYSWRQMREIRLGLEQQLDVGKYNSRLYSWDQMREVRLGLELGLDVESYRLLRYPAGEMRKRRLDILKNILMEHEIVLEKQVRAEDFLFEISANEMAAYVTVLASGKEISREDFLKILEESGIHKGICEENIEKITEGKYGKEAILIAKGEIPHKGADGWYEFFFRTNVERKPKVLEDGTVDYQNVEWYETVKKGQTLACYHEAQDGIDGYTVTGNIIKARKGAEKSVLVGKGFYLDKERKTYIATMSGMIRLEDRNMDITRHLMVEDVSMATGNVNFDGSVHILGDVGNGTVVKATDDIVIDGNVEGATIESGGSIILKKGANAAGHGVIKAERDILSKFFESVKVVANGNVEVGKSLNSQLYAGGKVLSSRRIAGGIAHAEQGFEIKHVGNHAGLPTLLKLNVNEKVWEENRRVRSAIADVEQELSMLNNARADFEAKFTPEIRSEMEVFIKIENAIFTKEKQLNQLQALSDQLKESVNRANEARVRIEGQAHEGTILEIAGCRWRAENQYNITVRRQENQVEILLN